MFISSRLRYVLLITVLATFNYSCTPSLLPTEDFKMLSQQPRIYAAHYPPRLEFIFHSEENAKGESIGKYFGPIGLVSGALSDISKGKAYGEILLQKYEIQDPVLQVKTKAIELLAQEANLANVQAFTTVITDEDTTNLKKTINGDMVIDFKTISWGMFSNKKTPERFMDMYRARSRVVRLVDGKIIWETECHIQQHDVATAPTLEELTSNHGALLKAIFQEDADKCADEIVAKFAGRS